MPDSLVLLFSGVV